MPQKSNLFYYIGIFAAIVVYIVGLPVEIMDIDAAQYASISWEMLETKSLLIVKNRHADYLDKPPLLFWLSALSYQVFGIHNWSYKLPAVLFALLAIYSTYRLSKLYYNEKAALMSALSLATCQAFFLFTNDVRTDTMLCGSVIFASWQLAVFLKEGKNRYFILGFIGVGLALLAKGPIGMVVPVYAFGADLLAKRQFKNIFRWQWLAGLAIVALMLMPMCVGLYQQYGTEGLRFYFWKQSFGRITGESEWRSNGGFFFLFHSFLWSFLPWSLLLLAALAEKIKTLIQQKFKIENNQEVIALAGALLTYASLAQSKYQLPHYIYVFFPYVAVVTGHYVANILPERINTFAGKFLLGFQFVVVAVLWAACWFLTFWAFGGGILQWIFFVVFISICVFVSWKKSLDLYFKALYISVLTAVGINLFMNGYIYPSLIKYQSDSVIGKKLFDYKAKEDETFAYKAEIFYALDLYSRIIVKIENEAYLDTMVPGKMYYVYTNRQGYDDFIHKGFSVKELLTAEDYHVTAVTLPFLNPATRKETLDNRFLLQVSKN